MRRLAAFAAALLVPAALAADPAPKPETNPDEAAAAPVAITFLSEELGVLLEGAGWVHDGTGRVPVYTVGFRSCPDCVAQKEGAYAKMAAAGADIRRIIYARADSAEGKPRSKPGERAMVAELWKTRDFALYQRWFVTDPATFYETETLPPDADSDPERVALVQKSRAFMAALNNILKVNGIETFVPAIFWQEDGDWFVYIGYNPETFDSLILPRLAGA